MESENRMKKAKRMYVWLKVQNVLRLQRKRTYTSPIKVLTIQVGGDHVPENVVDVAPPLPTAVSPRQSEAPQNRPAPV